MTQQDEYEPEEWRSLASLGFARYEVSNYGRVRSWVSDPPQTLKPFRQKGPHPRVELIGDDKRGQRFRINQLVAFAFLNAPLDRVIEHYDEDVTHCSVWNLRLDEPVKAVPHVY